MGLTPAVAGEMSPAVFAGVVAPAYLAGTDVPAVAEKEFLAVAEAWSLADDAEHPFPKPWLAWRRYCVD